MGTCTSLKCLQTGSIQRNTYAREGPWKANWVCWLNSDKNYLFANELWSVKHIYQTSRKVCRHIWVSGSSECVQHMVDFLLALFISQLPSPIFSAKRSFLLLSFRLFNLFSEYQKTSIFFSIYLKISEKLFNLDAENVQTQNLVFLRYQKNMLQESIICIKKRTSTAMMTHKTIAKDGIQEAQQ